MTLFGLRPKYTSVIVTIISGVLISFSTVAVMAVVNENVRVALFGLSKLQTRMNDLNQEIKVKNRELEKGSCFSLKQLAVNGNDLLGLGLSGPAVGRTLQGLLDQVMDGPLPNDRDALLTAARKIR